jgi:hypothetical protein
MMCDWTWDGSNFTTFPTIARKRSVKRVLPVGLVGAVTVGQALKAADFTVFLVTAAQRCYVHCRPRYGASWTRLHH